VRAALYARISTINKGQDVDLQLTELREYVTNRGWSIAGEYVDHISGSKDSRPALTRLMVDVHQRKCDAVLVWKLDRWGRSLKHLVNSMAELEARGVAFISLRDSLDLTTPAGRLMFQVIGAMAEFERELIRERVCAGLRLARSRGKRLGRPQKFPDIVRIASLRAKGRSWRQVGAALAISAQTARRAWLMSPLSVSRPAVRQTTAKPGPQTAESTSKSIAVAGD
jgi:DNA invertase Pin-like site-specific DNA recombinase